MDRRILFLALIAFAPAQFAFADSPSVTAVLSNSEAAVGETVRLQIRVTGSGAKAPGEIQIEGLEIRQTGTEQHYEMLNFSVTQSVTYNYTILPMKAGKFKIPPQTVQAGGSTLRTPELALNVIDSPGRSGRANPNASQPATVDPKKIAFIQFIVPKNQAYVGEIVPAVVKLCFNPRVPIQVNGLPEINAQGLTVQKMEKSGENLETINGATYKVITFKTALAAARTGKFEIPPLEMKATAMIPRRRSLNPPTQRPRSPFDLFNLDPFDDPFLGDVQPQNITIRSEPTTFEVKPLPPNAPPNFSGAVGNFTMTADAKPKSVQVGDPITVASTITGRGNFDRVNAPPIEDDRGWQKYPPSSKFEKDDDVGISGTKTFEMVLSPREKKETVPALLFAYFDPVKEQYVSLRSEPIPVRVEGGASPATAPSPAAAANAQSSPDTTAKPAAKPQDILYQLTDLPARLQTFTPLYLRPIFWMAQVVPLLALLGFAGWKIRRARIDNREAQRTAALQHEAAELMRSLRRDDASPQEYFSKASRAVQVKTALARNVDPNVVDVEVATKTFGLDESERDQLRRLFARSDELRYSGAQNGAGTISSQDRHILLKLIENLRA